jgi:hypothetical protein
VEEIIAFWEQRDGLLVAPGTRRALQTQLQPLANLIAGFHADPRFDEAARMSVLRMMQDSFGEEAYIRSPGMFLSARLAACRTRNDKRKPSRSDLVDGMHAMYFPYVDIATCDRQTFDCLEPHFSKITGPRKPRIIRNGRLKDVLGAVQELPADA